MTTAAGHGRLTLAAVVPLALVCLASIVALLGSLVLSVSADNLGDAPFFLVFLLMPASLGAVGTLLCLRRPRNVVGWLLLVSGALAGLAFAGAEYVRLAEASGNLDRPFIVLAAWVSDTWFVPSIGMLVVFLPLLFPDGRLPGPRWRIVVVLGVYGVITGALGTATTPGPLGDNGALPNPFVPPQPLLDWIQLAATIGNVLAPPIFLVAVASLVLRFRRAGAAEREQIKWLLFVAAFAAVAFAISLPNIGLVSDAGWLVGLVTLGLLPIAIAIAILRYRLYEIDRIISRTVSYALITALLAASYVVAFLVLQALLAPFTESSGPVVVAASTLLVFALFSPIRRRIGGAVDRRFNRRRYDAEREVAVFSSRARDETDIGRLEAEVAETVRRTLAPSRVVVWTRPE
jgi:hypothetical protein